MYASHTVNKAIMNSLAALTEWPAQPSGVALHVVKRCR